MTLASLKSAIDLGIDEEGLEEIRRILADEKKSHICNIEQRAQTVEKTYQSNKKLVDALVLDFFETPEDFFDGTGVDPLPAYSRDICMTKLANPAIKMFSKHFYTLSF